MISTGNKIMTLHYGSITVLDSCLCFQNKLNNFPKCMGVDNVEKGYHPYLFTDIDYVGDIVSHDYFDLKSLRDSIVLGKERLTLLLWNGCKYFEKMCCEIFQHDL